MAFIVVSRRIPLSSFMKSQMLKNRILQLFLVALLFFALSGEVAINAMPVAESTVQETAVELPEEWIKDQLGDGLSLREEVASGVVAEEFTKQISNVEWLAPMAPVALSPFFGITLLSGLACFGPEWLPDNALLSAGSPLANPNLFWAFLVLTVVTSIPRFSKVSKPVAQVADFLETYSAIVILLVLKVMSMEAFQASEPEVAMVEAGILSASWEGLLMIAMAINIVVVNSVKFFFEILVWITPIPFLDACFEAANKSVCVGLMAIYAYSPVAALVLNILIFIVSALAFTWIRRREIFFRTMLVDWMVQKFSKTPAQLNEQLVVFPKSSVGSIPARSKCLLEKKDGLWQLTHQRMIRAHLVENLDGKAELDKGWWTNSVVFEDGTRLTFSTKFADQLDVVSDQFSVPVAEVVETDLQAGRQIEFA